MRNFISDVSLVMNICCLHRARHNLQPFLVPECSTNIRIFKMEETVSGYYNIRKCNIPITVVLKICTCYCLLTIDFSYCLLTIDFIFLEGFKQSLFICCWLLVFGGKGCCFFKKMLIYSLAEYRNTE